MCAQTKQQQQSQSQYQIKSRYNIFEIMSSKGLGKPLTTQLVFTKTKSDSLHNIKNLNLWGNDLQDLSLIEKMPNLEVVSLSVNRISTLKQFANCQKLQELYLRKNNITDLRQIRYLVKLPVLKVLWLHDNPCSQVQNYREIVIKCLPNLMKLDNNPITPEDRASSQKITFNLGAYGGSEENYKSQVQNQPQGQHHNQSYSQEYKNYTQEQKWQRPNTAQSNSSQKKSQQQHAYDERPNIQRNQRNISSAQSGVSSTHSSYQQQQQQMMGGMGGVGQQKWNKKPMQRKSNPDHALDYVAAQQNMNRNQNILMAILSLMRQLDPGSLQIIRRETDKMLDQR